MRYFCTFSLQILPSKSPAGMPASEKDRAQRGAANPPRGEPPAAAPAAVASPAAVEAAQPPVSFEAALEELETIVATMEAGELTLEQSLSAYKRGATLLQYCQSALKDAQHQVKVLEAGVLQDFPGADDNG